MTHLAPEDVSDAHARIIDDVGKMIRRVSVPFDQDEVIQLLVSVGEGTRTSETLGLLGRAGGGFRRKQC